MARCGGAIMGAPTKIQALGIGQCRALRLDNDLRTCSKDIARAYADVAGRTSTGSMRSPRNTWVSRFRANVDSRRGAQQAVGPQLRISASNWRKPFRAPTGQRPDSTANSGRCLTVAGMHRQSNIVFNTALVKLVTNAEGVVIRWKPKARAAGSSIRHYAGYSRPV